MLKKCMAVFFLCAVCFALLAVPQFLGEGLLFDAGGVYIFYSRSESSGAEITLSCGEDAAGIKRGIRFLTGESTSYADAASAFAQAERYDARLLFSESAGGVDNYYYYSPRLGGAVRLYGHPVNLHIAVRAGGAAVGSPLIFGGY